MDLSLELNKIYLDESLSEKQKKEESLKLIQGLDFHDYEVRRSGDKFIRDICNNLNNNYQATIPEFWMRAMNEVVVRNLVVDMGLENIQTIYEEKTPEGESFAAFHSSGQHSLTFFEDNNYFSRFKNLHGPDRLLYVGTLIMVAAHELEHEVQELNLQKFVNSPYVMSPDDYLMSLHFSAQRLSRTDDKYQQETFGEESGKLSPFEKTKEKIYNKNHDEFLFEIDSDLVGHTQALNMMQRIAPNVLRYSIDYSKEQKEILEKKFIDHSIKLQFSHKSNANDNPVRATHKSSLIVDSTLPKCSKSYQEWCFQYSPSLTITRHKDGKKKMLQEIHSDFEAERKKIIETKPKEEQSLLLSKLSALERTVIENDPILLLEESLQRVIDIKITDPSDKTQLRKAIQTFGSETKRIEGLVSYIEEADYDILMKLIYEAKVAIKNSPLRINSNVTQEIYTQRSRFFNNLHLNLLVNKDVKKVQNQRTEEAKVKQQKYNNALDILKTTFPGFKPAPSTYALNDNQIINNTEERYIVEESIDKYLKDLKKYGKTDKKTIEETEKKLRDALETVYPFDITPGIRRGYEMKLDIEEISTLNNVYTRLERNLQKITGYQFDGKNYYFDDDTSKLYSPAEFEKTRKEILLETKEILASMDEFDYQPALKIIKSAKTTAQKQPKRNNTQIRLYESKIRDLREIDLTVGVNAEFKKAIQKQVDARIEREEAVKLLQSVFPNYEYHHYKYSGTIEHIKAEDNYEERFLVSRSIDLYIKEMRKTKEFDNQTLTKLKEQLNSACRLLYPFVIPEQESLSLRDKFDFKDIHPYDNKYAKYSDEKLDEGIFSNLTLDESLQMITNFVITDDGDYYFAENLDKIYSYEEFYDIQNQLLLHTKKLISQMKESDYVALREKLDSTREIVATLPQETNAEYESYDRKKDILTDLEKTVKANKSFTRFTQNKPNNSTLNYSLDECIDMLSLYTHNKNGYSLPKEPEEYLDSKSFNKKMSDIALYTKKLIGSMTEDDYKEVERKINRAKKDIEKSPKKTPEEREVYRQKLNLMREVELAVDANRNLRKARNKLTKKRLDREKAGKLITSLFPGFNPQALIGGGTVEHIELKDNVDEKLLLEKSFIQYKIDREKDDKLKKLSPEISDKDFLTALESYYSFEVTPENRAIFEDKFNRTIFPIRNLCSPPPLQSEGITKTTIKATETYKEQDVVKENEVVNEDETEME